MNTFAKRLKFARERLNLTQQEVADRVGMSQPTYYKIESGKSKRTTYLNGLANVLKVNHNWLATGQGEMVATYPDASLDLEHVSDANDSTSVDKVFIPFYKDFALACEHSQDGVACKMEKHKLKISRATVEQIGSCKDKIIATLADGDSMSPTINDGDTIWVDLSKETIKDGKIFVFEYGGLFMCKRLYRLPNNGLRVVSDNAVIYPAWEITGDECLQNGFKLIGWVWHWSVIERW